MSIDLLKRRNVGKGFLPPYTFFTKKVHKSKSNVRNDYVVLERHPIH